MKNKIILTALVLASFLAVIVSGCVSANPSTAPVSINGGPATNPPPAFIVDPRLTNGVNTSNQIAQTAAPFNPYAGMTNPIIQAIGGVLIGVSTLLAKSRNNHKNAADSLAQATVAQGQSAITAALQIAGANNAIGTVAQHIDNNTAPTPSKT